MLCICVTVPVFVLNAAVCKNFESAGWCRFDDRCEYLRM